MNACSFFGHRDFLADEETTKKLKETITDLIINKNITNFYIGARGMFDSFCLQCLKELKKSFPQIKIILIAENLAKISNEVEKTHIERTYDEVIYPSLENCPPKYIISHKNEWIINNSNFIIFYVNYSWGGASKFLDMARKKHKDYINLGRRKL